MTIAVRIVLDSGNVDFYEDEVLDVRQLPEAKIEIKTFDNALPDVQVKSDVWDVLQIMFRETYKTTKAKLQSVINEKAVMDIYYKYNVDDSVYISGLLIPDINEFRYFGGDEEANIEHQFTFLECE